MNRGAEQGHAIQLLAVTELGLESESPQTPHVTVGQTTYCFELCLAALAALQSFPSNTKIVAIAGTARRGKSTLSNMLVSSGDNVQVNQQSMYPVCAGSTTITKGIWMWDKPIQLGDGSYGLVLDTEGTCRGVDQVTRVITAFATFVCSLLVYNADHHLSNTDLLQMAVMGGMAGQSSTDTFPGLFILLRDLPTDGDADLEEGYPLTTYLNATLETRREDGEDINAARGSLKNLFTKRYAFNLLPPENSDRNALTSIPTFIADHRGTEYKDACNNLVNRIWAAALPKTKGGVPIGGEELALIMPDILKAVCKGSFDDGSVIERVQTRIVESFLPSCLDLYANTIAGVALVDEATTLRADDSGMQCALAELHRRCVARGLASTLATVVKGERTLNEQTRLLHERRMRQLRDYQREKAERERVEQEQRAARLAEERRIAEARAAEQRRRLAEQLAAEERRRASQPIQIVCHSYRCGSHSIVVVPAEPVANAIQKAVNAFRWDRGHMWFGQQLDPTKPLNQYRLKDGDPVLFTRDFSSVWSRFGYFNTVNNVAKQRQG